MEKQQIFAACSHKGFIFYSNKIFYFFCFIKVLTPNSKKKNSCQKRNEETAIEPTTHASRCRIHNHCLKDLVLFIRGHEFLYRLILLLLFIDRVVCFTFKMGVLFSIKSVILELYKFNWCVTNDTLFRFL